LRVWEAFGRVFCGWGRDDPDEIRAALEVVSSAGVRMVQTVFNALLADAALRAGRRDEANDAIAWAFATMAKSGERGFESLLVAVRESLRAVSR
jgi:hypothetical protein